MFQIKQKVQELKQNKSEKEIVPRIHHILMREYGWIPLDEFKKLPIPTTFSLMEQIRQDKEQEKKEYDKRKR